MKAFYEHSARHIQPLYNDPFPFEDRRISVKTVIDYTKRLTPKFDAVEDVKEWLGTDKWNEVSPKMAQISNPQQFAFLAGLAGVHDFAVEAWYDLYWGDGAYKREWAKIDDDSREPIKSTLWNAGNPEDPE